MNDKPAPEIGPVVQRRRSALGLTLEQLAARCGVSKSMLSQIERGQANPTFAVLWSLTRALKLDFDDLLQGAAGPKDEGGIEVVAAANTPEIRSADGRCRLRILGSPRLAGATDGNLGAHIDHLARAGYVEVAKTFVARRPRTTVKASRAGRDAFARHVAFLREIIARE